MCKLFQKDCLLFNTFILSVFYKHLCHLKWRQALSLACHGWKGGARTLIDFHLAGQWLSHSGSQVSLWPLIPQGGSISWWVKTLGFYNWWRQSVGDRERLSCSLWMFVFLAGSLDNKPILLILSLKKIRNYGLPVNQRWEMPYYIEAKNLQGNWARWSWNFALQGN